MNKMTVLNVIMFMSGITLVYSGIKGYKPQDVLVWSLGGPKPQPWIIPGSNTSGEPYGGQLGGTGHSGVAPGDHPGDMPWTYGSSGSSASAITPTNPTAGGIVSV